MRKADKTLSRRSVLSFGVKAAAAAGLANLFSPGASAASGDRICVCIYLIGGNDSNNLIVPLESSAYASYAAGRGSLALAKESLLQITSPSTSASFGFHPNLPAFQDLYNQGALAVVANVGRMERPLTKAMLRANPDLLPKDLFLHTAATQLRYLPQGRLEIPWTSEASDRVKPSNVTTSKGAAVSGSAGAKVEFSASFPETSVGEFLRGVATDLQQGSQQTSFLCDMGGFDTCQNQLARQAALFSDLNDAIAAFYSAMRDLGMTNRVTLYTFSEFNRTLAPNKDFPTGTLPGWGGHHIVVGGSVRGGDVYGRFPSLQLGGPDDLGNSGVWIPSVSDQQFGATLANWYGRRDLNHMPEFSSLGNFEQSNLGLLAN